MIISTNQELRLHIPSNAIDNISLLQGILDNSEKDFLVDKLGMALYSQLCEYYTSINPKDFYNSIVDGSYSNDYWAVLLLNAQRVVVNDALARFAYQQAISINSSGVNVSSSNDYNSVDEKMLDKSVQGFKKEALVSLNNMLVSLENWAKKNKGENSSQDNLDEIVELWKQSKYYYNHADLIIPNCECLQYYLDIYDNRDKFIRLLPELHFIQDEYITEIIGEDNISLLLSENADRQILRKVRYLIVAYLKERTSVIPFDKNIRLHAHDESVLLKESILKMLNEKKLSSKTDLDDSLDSVDFQNNQPNSKIFVSPLLY